jgi:hypothetical protein
MLPEPSENNGALDPGAKVVARAASREKCGVDALDLDAAILHRLDAVRDLDLACARRHRDRTRSTDFMPSHDDPERVICNRPLLVPSRHLQIADH